MRALKVSRVMKIPKDVKVEIKGRTVTVSGPRGTLTKTFSDIQVHLTLIHSNTKLRAEIWHVNKIVAACLRTVTAAVSNMIKGVTKGFLYKMRLVYAHFPININIEKDGGLLEIRNFLGEKIVRRVEMPEGVKVERTSNKDELQLSGNDINKVSQTAARVQQSCLVKDKDIRKFLDGIYVSEKTTVVEE